MPPASAGQRPVVLLVNLGTPETPAVPDVRRYLGEFLVDRHVVDLPPWFWRPLLRTVILPIRAPKSARKYASIWLDKGSPLAVHTSAMADALSERLPQYEIRYAMRYGQPSLRTSLAELRELGAQHVLVVPLFPQSSMSTTGSISDEVASLDIDCAPVGAPHVTIVPEFHLHPAYLDEVASRIENAWMSTGRPDFAASDKLVLSFHGIPVAMERAGDGYRSQCHATSAEIRARLGLTEREVLTTFQSRFGPSKWIGPATSDTMTSLGASGTRRVDVICPGFVTDCLETLEEIAILNRAAFEAAGDDEFHYIPCANAGTAWVDALTEIVTDAARASGLPSADTQ